MNGSAYAEVREDKKCDAKCIAFLFSLYLYKKFQNEKSKGSH